LRIWRFLVKLQLFVQIPNCGMGRDEEEGAVHDHTRRELGRTREGEKAMKTRTNVVVRIRKEARKQTMKGYPFCG